MDFRPREPYGRPDSAMAITQGTLQDLVSGLQAVAGPGHARPGEAVTARLLPADFSSLTLPDLLNLPVDLNINGTLDQTVGNITQTLTSTLQGALNLPVSLPVSLTVRWRVTDDQGNDLTAGADFIALDGLGGPQASFLFRPETVELTTSLALKPALRFIVPHVRISAPGLSAAGAQYSSDLPPIPIAVLPIPVPTVLVLFEDAYFDEQFLLIVPPDSPVTSIGALKDLLENLKPIALELARFPAFATFLLGIDNLSLSLGLPGRFKAARVYDDGVGVHNLETAGDAVDNDDWDNRASSLIFLGASRRVPAKRPWPFPDGPEAEAPRPEDFAGEAGPTGEPSPGVLGGVTYEIQGRSVQCFNDAFGSQGFVVSAETEIAVLLYNFDDLPLFSVPPDQVAVCSPADANTRFNDLLTAVRFSWGLTCPPNY